MAASNKGYHVWEAVEHLSVRSFVGRIVIPPPAKRAPKVAKKDEEWFFCKCLRAFCNEAAFVEHQKSHEESESSNCSAVSECGSALDDPQVGPQPETSLQAETTDMLTPVEEINSIEPSDPDPLPVPPSEPIQPILTVAGEQERTPSTLNELTTETEAENTSIHEQSEEEEPIKRRKVELNNEKLVIYPLRDKTRPSRPSTKITRKITASGPPKTGTAAGFNSPQTRLNQTRGNCCGYCGLLVAKIELANHMKQCRLSFRQPTNNSPSKMNWV